LSQLRVTYLLTSLAIVLMPQYAAAHDGFTARDPSQKIEKQVGSLREKMATAQAAGVPAEALQSARFVYLAGVAWRNLAITVCFWNGSKATQDLVMKLANEWTQYGAITFSAKTNGSYNVCQGASSANIRVSLDDGDTRDLYVNQEDNRKGNWSYLGNVDLSTYLVTLNLPDVVRLRTRDPGWTHHAIRHEFGHALGLEHEHQRAECAGWFNFDEIAKDTGWTVDYAKTQIGTFPDSDLAGLGTVGGYDKNSIMQYNFAKNWLLTKPGETNPCIRPDIEDLSDKDKAGIRALYPPVEAMPGPHAGLRSAKGKEGEPVQSRPTSPEDIAKEREKLNQIQATLQAKALQRSGDAEANAKAVHAAAALQDVITSLDQVESMMRPTTGSTPPAPNP
jgi:Astacin (Peptidase family M12A)